MFPSYAINNNSEIIRLEETTLSIRVRLIQTAAILRDRLKDTTRIILDITGVSFLQIMFTYKYSKRPIPISSCIHFVTPASKPMFIVFKEKSVFYSVSTDRYTS